MFTVMLTSKIAGKATVFFSGFTISPFPKRKMKCHLLNFHVGDLSWQWCLEEQQPCLWTALDPSSTVFFCPHHVVCSLHIICPPLGWLESLPSSPLFFFSSSDICSHLLSRAHYVSSAAWCASLRRQNWWFPYRHKHMVMFSPEAPNIQCHRLDSWCHLGGGQHNQEWD